MVNKLAIKFPFLNNEIYYPDDEADNIKYNYRILSTIILILCYLLCFVTIPSTSYRISTLILIFMVEVIKGG